MLEDSSNQALIDAWNLGNEQAAQVLVERYMVRLCALARSRLSRKLSRRLDAEDIVLSAWRSFFVAAGNGRLAAPQDDLWPILVTITQRKLARQAARHRSQRRDAYRESEVDMESDWRSVISSDPSPEVAIQVADDVEYLMASLSEFDRWVLSRRLQGEDQLTIAAALKSSERTVRRSMQRIREQLLSLEQCPDSPHSTSVRHPDHQDVGDVFSQPQPDALTMQAKVRSELLPTVAHTDIILQRLVGQGGVGRVYRARQQSTDSTIAVKYLKKRFWRNVHATQGLINEALRVSALSHPGVIQCHGWGRSPRGSVFIVMEWVDGSNAYEWTERAHPTIQRILECVASVAETVAATHAAGIIHGDLTPGNVLCREDGSFVLTDFGFALSSNDRVPYLRGGTPGFLAPEQVSEAFGSVTNRTDIYGLGGLLLALLTGRPPVTGIDTPDVLAQVLSARRCSFATDGTAEIPAEVMRVLRACLSKEPASRPSSASEVQEMLREIMVRREAVLLRQNSQSNSAESTEPRSDPI